MSHPDAALYIQVPMLATTVAVHMTVNDGCRNGAHGDDGGGVVGVAAAVMIAEPIKA